MAGTVARVALAARDQLGEGPHWDGPDGRLLRVDMRTQQVLAFSPATGATSSWAFAAPPSVVVPTSGDRLVVAAGDEIVVVAGDSRQSLCRPPGLNADVVLNDGKCDPAGRLWIGSYCASGQSLAALYRIDADGSCQVARTGLRASNGLAWSPSGHRFYHVDTPTQAITSSAFDVADGVLGPPEPFVDLADVPGVPDGIAADVDGGIWVAMFGGGHLRRYRADGTVDQVVDLPVSHPTSLAFGDDDLRTLYITTSRHRLTPAMAAEQPDAGAVLAVAVGVAGTPVARFGTPQPTVAGS